MTYNLFISHSWSYKNQYDNLVSLLDGQPYFQYKNYSVPKDDPLHTNGNTQQLRDAISEQIRNSHVVLVMAGVYSTYSKWINIEIELCKPKVAWEQGKPIVAIEPWGSERTSQHVKDNATTIVSWNSSSIVNAIRDVVR